MRRPVRRVAALRRRHGLATPGSPHHLGHAAPPDRPAAAADRRHGVAQLPESGRGLAIMRACVDDVTLSSGPGQGTVVSLQKRIGWRADAAAGHGAPAAAQGRRLTR